jgi:hypothetical protein
MRAGGVVIVHPLIQSVLAARRLAKAGLLLRNSGRILRWVTRSWQNGVTGPVQQEAEAAADHQTGVVLLLDEIQFLRREQLEAVVAAIHKTVQRELPITMVGAGLPQIAELAGEAKSFAERLFKFPDIGVLSEVDAHAALSKPAAEENVDFEDAALQIASEVTERYPYFLQELGYAVWPLASNNRITRTDVEQSRLVYEDKLGGSFFRARLDRGTELSGVSQGNG